jgi:toxin ParE1/3/4
VNSVSLIVKPHAQDDIINASAFYETRKPGLGREFITALDDEFAAILQFPASRPVFFRDFRVGLTKRFPFRIFYMFENNSVTVFAVLHQSREFRRVLHTR